MAAKVQFWTCDLLYGFSWFEIMIILLQKDFSTFFGLSGMAQMSSNGFRPKWHRPKCLVAEVSFGPSDVGPSGFGLNGFGRSGNKAKNTTSSCS